MSPMGNGLTTGTFQTTVTPGYRNNANTLPEVYMGHPNRIERISAYENMDMDSEVNAALDILAEFCTQKNEENLTPFEIHYHETPAAHEVSIISEQLKQWSDLNEFNKRMFKIVRNVFKYGDQVFIRDPETFRLFWTEIDKVTKVIVNEAKGKEPEQYVIKDLSPNFMNLTTTAVTSSEVFTNHPQVGGPNGSYIQNNAPYSGGSRFSHKQNESVIDAAHVVHLSLTEGLDAFWPFGTSVLENVFKVFKQKELLEDSIIIYRIQRAPERRVFKVDVGGMPPHMAMAFVERVKTEVNQRRIPSNTGGVGAYNFMDSTYSPISTNEDYFFPQTESGRGSSVEVLPGGSNLGEITDLRFFTNKLFRGLRIPSTYLPTTIDDGPGGNYGDGRVGTALIQEWRFNQYCMRLQNYIIDELDKEFKMFMKWRGFNIDNDLFELRFTPPQNFAQYRQADIDSAKINTFSSLEGYPYFSKRFLMQRYLGLTETEMAENSKLWLEENASVGDSENQATLRNVGITPGGISADLETTDMGDMGMGGEDLGDIGDIGGVGDVGDMGTPAYGGASPVGSTTPGTTGGPPGI